MSRRRDVEVFGLSFLDCICCGFGAIVLLLVLSKSAEPTISEQTTETLSAREAQLRQLAEEIAGQRKAMEDEIAAAREALEAAQRTLAALRVSSHALEERTAETKSETRVTQTIEQRLAAARQSLTEEMRRLQAQGVKTRRNAPVGGIPVDSEYVVFVIDTSGSMQRFAWNAMLRTMVEILDLYPKVKGIQVMSDEGAYLFNSYRGQWIPDTPGRRKATIDAMRNWKAFSDSSPVEGIEAAIRTFAAPDKRISVYVMGDDFTGPSAEAALARIRRVNPKDARGVPRARIHAIGFPTQYGPGGVTATGVRFANLMRIMCRENGGAFVGLTSNN